MQLPSWRGKRILTLVAFLLGAALLMPKPAAALTPEDPAVRASVQRALKYLETANDKRLGGICLIGLCFQKAGMNNHPKIAFALDFCEKADIKAEHVANNYSLGIALMFLCEVDPQKHKALIEKYVDEMFRRQKAFGAWSYPEFQTGDTSQTQYAVLGMWMAKNFAEIDIPIEKLEGVAGWLMRTQDTGGGWRYQGIDPGVLNRIPQPGFTPTLSASGAGSIYMCADLLQVTQRVDVPNAQKSKALQDVEVPGKKGAGRGPITVTLNPADIKATLASADQFMGSGFAPQDMWNHYYMYALERYHSFREKAGGAQDNKWYDQGFAHLARIQKENGSFDGSEDGAVNTSLAVLFLLRSSAKSIVKQRKLLMGDGVMVAGGIRLPKDIRSIQVSAGGKVVDPKVLVPTEQILALIKDGPNEEVTRLAEEREALVLSGNKTERQSQLEQLRKFVGAGDYHVRMLAVTSLSKVHDLDNVPKLIFALTDPDPRIAMQADRGLRFISRKVSGMGMAFDPTKAQIKAAEEAWKSWYLSIRPNAELLD